jgi:glycosyltransferase A (GT-A) superfamily protein (DUF2064 family)
VTDVLAVLARAPHAGSGKTRLRATLAGCPRPSIDALVAALVADTLSWASRPRRLVVAGADDDEPLRHLAPHAIHVAQPDATFGVRIEHAISAGFAAGGTRVVQIGTDSPTLPAALLDVAFESLRGADDAVLVPAVDGGWVALGLARSPGGALAAAPVRWSTRDAAADTVDALRAAGLRVAILPPWYDIDGEDGLRRLRRDPVAPFRAPRSLAALRSIDAAAMVVEVPA